MKSVASTRRPSAARQPGRRQAPASGTRLIELQSTAGNRAVARLVAGGMGPRSTVVHSGGIPNLHGTTTAKFSSRFAFEGRTARAKGCRKCGKSPCVHVVGTVNSTFEAAIAIKLPKVPRGLSECEAAAAESFIQTTLTEHEQDHERRLGTYRGTVETPVDFVACRSAVDAKLKALHRTLDKARQTAARSLSAKIDPFRVKVPSDC